MIDDLQAVVDDSDEQLLCIALLIADTADKSRKNIVTSSVEITLLVVDDVQTVRDNGDKALCNGSLLRVYTVHKAQHHVRTGRIERLILHGKRS